MRARCIGEARLCSDCAVLLLTTLCCFCASLSIQRFKPLVRAKQSGMYHAEQAWREILLKSGVRSFVTGWFAGLAKARLARAPDGTLSIEKWHCYRAAAWDELKPWLAAKGFADEWAPITLPSLPS